MTASPALRPRSCSLWKYRPALCRVRRCSRSPALFLLYESLSHCRRRRNEHYNPRTCSRNAKHGPEMVVVPAGDFTMGAPVAEQGSDDDERPQHRVAFAEPFAVGRFAITFAEWDACVADGGCKRYRPGDRGWGRGHRPVINLWWEDARAYVAWLSQKTGHSY